MWRTPDSVGITSSSSMVKRREGSIEKMTTNHNKNMTQYINPPTAVPAPPSFENSSSTPAPAPDSVSATEAKIRREVIEELNDPIPKNLLELYFPIHGWDKVIPPGLEDEMVAYRLETLGMSLGDICEHFDTHPFEGILDLLDTDSKFKVSARDLHEALESPLDFHLWIHLMKGLHNLEAGKDYQHDTYLGPHCSPSFTLDAAIHISRLTDSDVGTCVSDACFDHMPGFSFNI